MRPPWTIITEPRASRRAAVSSGTVLRDGPAKRAAQALEDGWEQSASYKDEGIPLSAYREPMSPAKLANNVLVDPQYHSRLALLAMRAASTASTTLLVHGSVPQASSKSPRSDLPSVLRQTTKMATRKKRHTFRARDYCLICETSDPLCDRHYKHMEDGRRTMPSWMKTQA